MIERVPRLRDKASHTLEWLRKEIIDSVNYAHEQGMDRPEITGWKWPY